MRETRFKFEARAVGAACAPSDSARRSNVLATTPLVALRCGAASGTLRPRGTSGAPTRRIALP